MCFHILFHFFNSLSKVMLKCKWGWSSVDSKCLYFCIFLICIYVQKIRISWFYFFYSAMTSEKTIPLQIIWKFQMCVRVSHRHQCRMQMSRMQINISYWYFSCCLLQAWTLVERGLMCTILQSTTTRIPQAWIRAPNPRRNARLYPRRHRKVKEKHERVYGLYSVCKCWLGRE